MRAPSAPSRTANSRRAKRSYKRAALRPLRNASVFFVRRYFYVNELFSRFRRFGIFDFPRRARSWLPSARNKARETNVSHRVEESYWLRNNFFKTRRRKNVGTDETTSSDGILISAN